MENPHLTLLYSFPLLCHLCHRFLGLLSVSCQASEAALFSHFERAMVWRRQKQILLDSDPVLVGGNLRDRGTGSRVALVWGAQGYSWDVLMPAL